ncbi:MAG TPA: zf-TFIIB domain-containing protein [Tepidisphaeraceae bacterium]|jgi:Zn-finger nucleic acid-binding protein|nr:zf-TFIIB domain-containing protein [Tepidisphaeraceae bacterium]
MVNADKTLMKCPVCKTAVLLDDALPGGPPSHRCSDCRGHWVEADRYWKWLETRSATQSQAASGNPAAPVVESAPKAKLCPECGRLLTRAKVGRGADFFLERCSHCGGIWFDADEWDTLLALGLHDDVHFVFSDAWQAEIARIDRQRQHDRLLREKLGDVDFDKIQQIKTWLDGHPHRVELYAILLDDKNK